MLYKQDPKRLNNSVTIELTKEGEVYRSYIVLVDLSRADSAISLVFRIESNGFYLVKLFKMDKDRFKEDISLSRIAYGKGGNEEYILVTRFLNSQVFKCHFIPAHTLNKTGIVSQVLKKSF